MIVLLVVVDSLRADAPSFAGGAAPTPLLDRLAGEGTWFADLYASGASTVPSFAAMLTGSLPHRVGVGRWRAPFLPNGRRPTLTTAFAAAGYRVACFHPYPRWGFMNLPAAGPVGDSQDPDAIVAALAEAGGGDSLVIVHHWWTHLPYVTRRLELGPWHRLCDFALESLGRHPATIAPKLRALYHRSVSSFSEELLGRYLDAASAGGRDVLLALVGDHGENWGEALPPGRRVEHVYDLHGRWLADATIRVPLLLWGHGRAAIPARGRQDGVVCGVDVAPTIAALAGVPFPSPNPLPAGEGQGEGLEIVGRSLAGWVETGVAEPAREALVVTSHNAWEPRTYPSEGPRYWRAFGLRSAAGWVVWDGAARELDVRSAPGREPPGAAELEAARVRLEAERLRAVDTGPLLPEPPRDTPVEERLRLLGYLE